MGDALIIYTVLGAVVNTAYGDKTEELITENIYATLQQLQRNS